MDIARHVAEEEVVAICRDLVRAPSENPPGDERLAAEVTETWLRRLGLPTERVEAAPGRVSVLSSWGPPDAGRTLLFNGHLDVVPATDLAEWPHPPYEAAVDGGRLYGRGSSDMKAGIAACLAAVSAMQRADVKPSGRLVMHFVADEEAMGYLGTKVLVERGLCDGVTEAVVGEPTAMHLVTAERGLVWVRIRTQGVPAHAATPHLGVNAIAHMAPVIEAVSRMRFKKLHEFLGGPTVNVGLISGGQSTNSVAASCTIDVDRRTLPGESMDEILAEFRAVLDDLRTEHPDLDVSLEVDKWADASETPPGTRIAGLLTETRDAMGVEGYEVGYSAATDARYLINDAGVPSVIFGPGDIGVAHTTGEFVELEQLVTGARIYAEAFGRFLCEP